MKTQPTAVAYDELYATWRAFRRHKRPSRAIDEFAYAIEHNLETLASGITQRTYRHGPYQQVVVQEKKRRDLAVASVRDRVVHRLVYDQLVGVFDRTFDPDVWSCRPKNGLHGCLKRTQSLLRRWPHTYVWRMDITKFFDHVKHERLQQCLARRPLPPDLHWLCQQIIDSFHCQPGVGIPIGNLTSQIFANIYLHEFDRYARHTLKPLAYVRYGDDVLMWAKNRADAEALRRQSVQFLGETLGLHVNPKNDYIVPARRGLHFLGHAVTSSYIVVDKHTTRSVLRKSRSGNIASYKSLRLAIMPKKQLDWQLLDELEEEGLL